MSRRTSNAKRHAWSSGDVQWCTRVGCMRRRAKAPGDEEGPWTYSSDGLVWSGRAGECLGVLDE